VPPERREGDRLDAQVGRRLRLEDDAVRVQVHRAVEVRLAYRVRHRDRRWRRSERGGREDAADDGSDRHGGDTTSNWLHDGPPLQSMNAPDGKATARAVHA